MMTSWNRHWLLIGGIGSGKSLVRSLLGKAGIRTIDADAIGHEVLRDEAKGEVARLWPDVVGSSGKIDRPALASIVFADPTQLAQLEEITHPLIFDRIEAQVEEFDGVTVVEMPLIELSTGWSRLVVDARDEVRVGRAIARGMSRDDVDRRMRAQPTRAEWLESADVVIPNHGSLDDLEATVSRLVDFLTDN